MITDNFIRQFDRALQTVLAPARTRRPVPGHELPEVEMTPQQRRHSAALMRINHVGEVCAQALYQGQAIVSVDEGVKRALAGAADEEIEHLAWTETRIRELGGRKSLLNPLWYAGALGIGLFAGKFGDRWNLGFLAETERQVESHLQSHLVSLPPQDEKSKAILDQMATDEIAHAQLATELGGRALPAIVKSAMRGAARVMKGLAYWV